MFILLAIRYCKAEDNLSCLCVTAKVVIHELLYIGNISSVAVTAEAYVKFQLFVVLTLDNLYKVKVDYGRQRRKLKPVGKKRPSSTQNNIF
jgi:hypothetical protein